MKKISSSSSQRCESNNSLNLKPGVCSAFAIRRSSLPPCGEHANKRSSSFYEEPIQSKRSAFLPRSISGATVVKGRVTTFAFNLPQDLSDFARNCAKSDCKYRCSVQIWNDLSSAPNMIDFRGGRGGTGANYVKRPSPNFNWLTWVSPRGDQTEREKGYVIDRGDR